MRRLNSSFITQFTSEKGTDRYNRTYYGFVELDRYYCLAIAESFDQDEEAGSAKMAVDLLISYMTQRPGIRKSLLRSYIKRAHRYVKTQSVKKNLKVSLLLIVSDYTKIRTVSCGNAQAILLRENKIINKSKTQSVYQKYIESGMIAADGIAQKEEIFNLHSFLGSHSYIHIEISPKKKLLDGDWLLAMSSAPVYKFTAPEVLEAYEESKEIDSLLLNMEELYLSGNADTVSSYCFAVTEAKKIYREEPKRKKRITMLIIILSLVTVLGLGSFFLYKNHSRKQNQIRTNIKQYKQNAQMSVAGQDYTTAALQYEKAVKEADRLSKNSEKLEAETVIFELQSLLMKLETADNAFLTGNMEQANVLYQELVLIQKKFPELGISNFIRQRVKESSQAVEVEFLREYAGLLEGVEEYQKSIETLEDAENRMRILGNMEGVKEIRLDIFRIDQLIKEKETQKAYESKAEDVNKIDAQATEAQQAVMDGDLDLAIEIYTLMRKEFIEVGEEEKAGEIYTIILSLTEQKKESGEQESALLKEIEDKKKAADQALKENDILNAIERYKELSYLYMGAGNRRAADEIFLLIWELENGELNQTQEGDKDE